MGSDHDRIRLNEIERDQRRWLGLPHPCWLAQLCEDHDERTCKACKMRRFLATAYEEERDGE